MPTRLTSLVVLALLLACPAGRAQTVLLKRVVASGGTDAATGTTHLRATVGQAAAGRVAGGSHALGQGFWAGAGATSVETGTVYVVNSAADPGTGTCDVSECTLREAITVANGHANASGRDQIHFAIPGSGLHTIMPASALPEITDPVVIDGYTQPGASPNTQPVGNDAVLRIELNGNGAAFACLLITAGTSTVRGLLINRFDGNGASYGLILRTGGGNVVVGNWIGVDASGTAAQVNSLGAVYLDHSAGDRIGGTDPADRNVLVGPRAGNTALFEQGPGGGHTIQGNYVGTNAAGTEALARGGIYLTASGTLIGGTAPGARNVLSTGGGIPGIFFAEEGASGNTVQGNYIGVTADGTAALSPTGGGVGISVQRAGGIQIGGSETGARNVIVSVNGAIDLFGSPTNGAGNTIQGNYLGTNAAGTAILLAGGSAGAGVRIGGVGNSLVGGSQPSAGNVIAGFAAGVLLYDSLPGNVIQGNRIGTNAAGMAALPNTEGILLAGIGSDNGNTIGGTTPAARNVISGNTGDGVRFGRGDANVFQGNYIGVAADGTTPLGNGSHGIEIGQGSGNTIGGTAPGAGNVIAYNAVGTGTSRYGVVVFNGTGNAIEGNAIYGNSRIGINLFVNPDATSGATPNDPGDADAGPNNLQNTPEITASGLSGGLLTVTYRVDTDAANAAYPLRVELFRAFNGEGGAAFLGADVYTAADHSGCGAPPCPKTVTMTPAAALATTDALVATATDAGGNTSEFSAVAHGVADEPDATAPTATTLHPPAPNPATVRARLRYDLATAGHVRLSVVDLLGREVAVVVDAEQPSGRFDAALDVERLATGVYIVRFQSGMTVQSHRFTVLR